MKITKEQLRKIIKEELTSGGMAKKSTDLEYARSSPRDQIGPVEATKLLKELENIGYVHSREAVTQLIEFLQTLEQRGHIRYGGWDE
tara:strand:- start:211 stop:471 length:261 start_codon:yes stop_codon:yes gene_type:complete